MPEYWLLLVLGLLAAFPLGVLLAGNLWDELIKIEKQGRLHKYEWWLAFLGAVPAVLRMGASLLLLIGLAAGALLQAEHELRSG